MPDRPAPQLSDLEAALKLFDETTGALAARIQRLEEVLVLKQQQLLAANRALGDKVSELDRVTAWLNLVMSAVASGVVAVDRAGRITTCNDAARAALAGCLAAPLGADYRAAFPDSPLLRVLDGAAPAAAYERTVPGPDGARRILAAKASPLRGSDGAMLGAVEVFEDVTEMRRLRESVERADRLKQLGEMAAGVAHEIRNPLNGIEGFASLLTRDLPADDQRHRYATHIVEGVRNLNRTVSVLLDFTRERRLERRPVPPVELARDCLELVRAELALRPADDGPAPALDLVDRWGETRIDADGGQLKQVLLNLIQNAVHAVDDGDHPEPRVTLTVEHSAEPAGIAFVVDDNGPGVPAEIRQRIFTPFYTTKDRGTGLGLAVAHAIVELHGGGIAVEDGPLGGARFRVTLSTA